MAGLSLPAVTERHALLDAVLEHVGRVVRAQSKATTEKESKSGLIILNTELNLNAYKLK